MANTADVTVQVRAAFADVIDLIPRGLRTAFYVGAVALALATLTVQRITAIWWPQVQDQVDATAAEILPWALFVIGVLGAAHRPRRGLGTLVPLEPGPLELAQAQESQARTVGHLMANGWDKDQATTAVTQQQLMPTGEGPDNVSGRSS
jgi:FAD/FMN-containing dehydrogenase